MKVRNLSFKAGSAPGAPPLSIQTGPVTIFVGPNYSGKSAAISEIAGRLMTGDTGQTFSVIEKIELAEFSSEEADVIMDEMTLQPNKGDALAEGKKIFGLGGDRLQLTDKLLKETLINPNQKTERFSSWYSKHKTLILNGSNRISLVNEQDAGDLLSPARSSFQKIFRDDALRSRLSSITMDALGLYLTVDPLNSGRLRLRLSKSPAPSVDVERSLTDQSIAFHSAATPIASTSDGAKAFVGIMAETFAGDPTVLLVDEPEAFLHPSLAFKLAKEISTEVNKSKKQMFVSTHSANFIMGCIQSGVDVNIVRLTYRNGVATARLLPSEELKTLMRNPLLRSVGVLSALFHESVVVTESDADRAFYQEINERLIAVGRGIPNAIFLNAQNKQTIPTIIRPLRKLGIPAAAIYDVDLVKDGGGTATSFLESAGIPTLSQQPINLLRAGVLKALVDTGKNFKREGGISLLSGADHEAAEGYLAQLKAYGAFVVPGGELESWLSGLGASGHGPPWLISMFEKLGEDPEHADFVTAGLDDVWAFLDDVRAWLHDPDRKGIPC